MSPAPRLYRHQAVRDLAWLIASPPLMGPGVAGLPVPPAAWLERLATEAHPWLDGLDRRPEELERWLARHRTTRLGHHAEALVEFWLRRHPGIVLHGARVPVADRQVTRGDLDLLFTCQRRGQRLHWEMAVKFYLGSPPDAAWESWIGPDPRDRLDLKLRRVIDHQLALGRHPAANHGATQMARSEAFLKGWLFRPAAGDWRGDARAPDGADPRHLRGWWLRHGDGEAPRSSRASRFALPERLHWLSPVRRPRGGHAGALSLNELGTALDDHFAHHHDAVLVAEVQPDREGWWGEIARGFVVAADWPH
jgi:hypothetical protein